MKKVQATSTHLASAATIALLLLVFPVQPACQASKPSPETDGQSTTDGGESLEGPMYEASGLQSNPARPQSSRPAPPPGP